MKYGGEPKQRRASIKRLKNALYFVMPLLLFCLWTFEFVSVIISFHPV